jgi:hypothetical protein
VRKNKTRRTALSIESKKQIRAAIVLRRSKQTRTQCEAAMSKGADPNAFLKHSNKHVVAKAEKLIARANAKPAEVSEEVSA